MDAVPRGRRMPASSGEGSQSLATGSLSEGYCNGLGRMACRLLRSAGFARRRPSASPLGQWVLTRWISRCLRVKFSARPAPCNSAMALKAAHTESKESPHCGL